jgi:hypothetical protein
MSIPMPEWSTTVSGDPYKYDPAKLMDYENTVANSIIRGDIATTKIGAMVLGRIGRSHGDVEIYPRYEQGLNAEAAFKLKSVNGRTVGHDITKIVIWFTPQQWKTTLPASHLTIPANLRAFEPGMLRDEVLFHELVHSGRLLDGFWPQKSEKLKPDPDNVVPWANEEAAAYEDIEEFATILVTNIYLSVKGQKVFRASHGGDGYPFILDQAQSSSEGFLSKPSNFALVKMFCQTDPLAPQLSTIDTPFNPVKAYFTKNPQDFVLNRSLQPA